MDEQLMEQVFLLILNPSWYAVQMIINTIR